MMFLADADLWINFVNMAFRR